MHTNEMSFSPDLIAKAVRCLEEAVGDDILADIQNNDLPTTNRCAVKNLGLSEQEPYQGAGH